MVCPHCLKNALESELIRANVKGFSTVDVVYDVFCPNCDGQIGRMFWGELILRSAEPRENQSADSGQRDIHKANSEERKAGTELMAGRLKVKPERREKGDRRTGEERRTAELPFFGPDRRREERRKADEDRRSGYDRRYTKKTILYDRRRPGSRRRKEEQEELDWKI